MPEAEVFERLVNALLEQREQWMVDRTAQIREAVNIQLYGGASSCQQ
jgi:hypothetical protein